MAVVIEDLMAISFKMVFIKVGVAKYHIKEIKMEFMEVLAFYFTQFEIPSQVDDVKVVDFNERRVMV